MGVLKVQGVTPNGDYEEVELLFEYTGDDTNGYDIVIRKKPDEEKVFDLEELTWDGFGCSIQYHGYLSNATCFSIQNWDIKGTKRISRARSGSALYYKCTATRTATTGKGRLLQSVTNMDNAFEQCSGIVVTPNMYTSQVTSFRNTFRDCVSLETVQVYDYSSARDTSYMFCGCTNLKKLPIMYLPKVTSSANMFSSCPSLEEIPITDFSNFVFSNGMFGNCESLVKVPYLDTVNMMDMNSFFGGCTSLEEFGGMDWISMRETYNFSPLEGCTALKKIGILKNIGAVPLSEPTDPYMPANLEEIEITFKDASDLTMQCFFKNCSKLTTLKIGNSASNVTNASGMLTGCTSLSVDSLNNVLKACSEMNTPTKTLYTYVGLPSSYDATIKSSCSSSILQAFYDAGWTLA